MKRRYDHFEKMGTFVQGVRDISKDRGCLRNTPVHL